MQPRKLLVFDLETVPDVAFARSLWPACAGLDDEAVRSHIAQTFLDKSAGRSDFHAPPFHQVVAIGCLLADIEVTDSGESYHFKKLGCIGKPEDDEAGLLKQWFDYAAQQAGAGLPLRLVSFNGRGFDLPVLKLRALKHNISAPWLFKSGDKWSNYGSRYDANWHVDMADVLADYGAARSMPKLDEVCTLIGLPGKLDIEGSKVADLFAAGKTSDIRDYCETDVLNTYLLYLRWQQLTGTLDSSALQKEEAGIREWLAKEGEQKPHLAGFDTAWPAA